MVEIVARTWLVFERQWGDWEVGQVGIERGGRSFRTQEWVSFRGKREQALA